VAPVVVTDQPRTDELRVVLPPAAPGGPPPKFVVGAVGPDKKFTRILEVLQIGDRGYVHIAGNLAVDGLYSGPPPVTGGTDLAQSGSPVSGDPANDGLLDFVLKGWLPNPLGPPYIAGKLWELPTGGTVLATAAPD